MNGHRQRVLAMQYHPTDRHLLITGGWDNTVQVCTRMSIPQMLKKVKGISLRCSIYTPSMFVDSPRFSCLECPASLIFSSSYLFI